MNSVCHFPIRWLKDSHRADYVSVTDAEAIKAFHDCCRIEGIIPALESAHAIAYAIKLAKTLPKDKTILINLSGRGDKDMHTVAEYDKEHDPMHATTHAQPKH